jgi:hypothetical protein
LPVAFCIPQAKVSLCFQILELFRLITAGLSLKDILDILNKIAQHSKYLFSENNILAMTMIIVFVETSIAQTLNRGHGKS